MAKKILLVDDSVAARMVMVKCLTSENYEIIQAENGDDALKKIAENPNINLVITDINMPWKDGIELLEELRKNEATKNLPVILASTESDSETIAKAKSLGVLGFLVKPINAETLRATAKKVLG